MKRCSVCGKGSIMRGALVKLRGHFNPTPKKRKYPNLQWLRLTTGGRVRACTQCVKTQAKKLTGAGSQSRAKLAAAA